jgi:branched-chain amino acid transport system ATP-binding protein
MLEVNGLRVSYGGIQAVRGITFHVNEGEMVALIGANGAGKSSTLRALARLLDPAGGSVRYRGKELLSLPPHALVSEGIALVPEGRGVFPRMSSSRTCAWVPMPATTGRRSNATSNMCLGISPAQGTSAATGRNALGWRTADAGDRPRADEQTAAAAARRAVDGPRTDHGAKDLRGDSCGRQRGMTILLVEQNAKLALEVSQRGYVMESGEITVTDESRRLLADPKVRAAYLGE